MAVDIRPLTSADHERAHALRVQAFSATPGSFDPDEVYVPDERRLGAFEDGDLVGLTNVWDHGQWFGHRRVACGGVAGVVVPPEHRRSGVASRLMAAALEAMHERGEAISTLYPMTARLYRRHGYEFAGEWIRRRVPAAALARLPTPSDPVRIRSVGEDAHADMAAVYARVAPEHNGNLDRSEVFTRRRLALDEGEYAYVVERHGEVVGYVVYVHRSTNADGRLYDHRVVDLVGVDVDAEIALWRLLSTGAPGTDMVEFVSRPSDPLLLLLEEDELRAPPRAWHWMTRLVDAASAVADRGYPEEASATVELEVIDAQAPWNAGRRVLEVADGRGSLTPGGRGTVSVDIGALAACWTGWARPRDLARLRRLRGASESAVAALERVFAGPTPWLRDFF